MRNIISPGGGLPEKDCWVCGKSIYAISGMATCANASCMNIYAKRKHTFNKLKDRIDTIFSKKE